ncbi:caspase family protein [Chitinophaga sp.]|uniref:caspase family protein n=1 Tax=Chitinophaga sp. TaxID=1869181 RepID=UPI0031E2F1AF
MSSIYALLVGINNYPSKPLKGCINDVKAVSSYLQKSVPAEKLHIKELTDNSDISPTRENLINSFDFFDSASSGDTCLFYYSGHGSYAEAPAGLETYGKGQIQSYVCIDSRSPNGKDLADKEMAFLIWKTLQKKTGLKFIAITDCCFSGTITKNFLDNSEIMDRMTSGGAEFIPESVEKFLGFGETVNGHTAWQMNATSKKYVVQESSHIHLAASGNNQTSKELIIDNEKRGAFTHSLLKALNNSGGELSYNSLIEQATALVKNLVPDQTPGININGELADNERYKQFLSNEIIQRNQSYNVTHDNQLGWCIHAGTLQAVSKGDTVNIKDQGETIVTSSAGPNLSTIQSLPEMTNPTVQYSGTITRQPNHDISVTFGVGVPQHLQSLLQKTAEEESVPFVTLTINGTAQYFIRQLKSRHLALCLPGTEQPLFQAQEVNNTTSAWEFLKAISKVAQWTHIYEFRSPQDPLTHQHYRLKLERSADPNTSTFEAVDLAKGMVELYYKKDSKGEWQQPQFRLTITNTCSLTLYITNLYLGFDYSITTNFFKEIELHTGESTNLTFLDKGFQKSIIPMRLEETYKAKGYDTAFEYLKLFISTEKIVTYNLAQDGLEVAAYAKKRAEKFVVRGPGKDGVAGLFAWSAETIGFKIVRPQEEITIAGGNTSLPGGIVIQSPIELTGKISITSSSAFTPKSANNITPPSSAKNNSNLEPFDLVGGQLGNSQADVLELFEINDRTLISRDNPLTIQLPLSKAAIEDFSIVPIGYDAETDMYYPLGYVDADGNIRIESLPAETPSDGAITKRSFIGSIRIYFQKIIGQKIGRSYSWPRLAIPTVTGNNVEYETTLKKIIDKVAVANTILLFIHGIIGDTEGMAKSSYMPLGDNIPLKDKYDLILTFDYENLNTPIEETATMLKKALEAVGLKNGHSKKLVIAAHSMGGLVSRWFIEKEKDNTIVSKLVMLGTPNNGSPWADVRDLADTLFTFSINGGTMLYPWMYVLSVVGKAVKGVQVTLKQMDAETGIYNNLNDGKDPNIPYVILAGNTQKILATYDANANLLERLFAVLKKRGIYIALDTILFKKANDIAVTDESIINIPGSQTWNIQPLTEEVICHHLNYFLTPAALEFIAAQA